MSQIKVCLYYQMLAVSLFLRNKKKYNDLINCFINNPADNLLYISKNNPYPELQRFQ